MPKRAAISRATASVAVAVQAITVGRPSRSAISGQAQVVGPEVVPPLGDAVRLVDREQVDAALLDRAQEDVRAEALGRAVDDPRLAAAHLGERAAHRLLAHRRGDHRHRVPGRVEPPPLVVHQRDQRADDDRQVLGRQAGELVAEALAAAGRHHDQRVAPRQRRLDGLALPGPPALEAELPQQLIGATRRRSGHEFGLRHRPRLCADADEEQALDETPIGGRRLYAGLSAGAVRRTLAGRRRGRSRSGQSTKRVIGTA